MNDRVSNALTYAERAIEEVGINPTAENTSIALRRIGAFNREASAQTGRLISFLAEVSPAMDDRLLGQG